MKIGDYIRKYREEHDMSGRAFANLVGVSVQHESNLERGVNNEGKPLKLTLPMVALIADATGIGQIDLLLMLDEEITINPEQREILQLVSNLSSAEMKQTGEFVQNLKSQGKGQGAPE